MELKNTNSIQADFKQLFTLYYKELVIYANGFLFDKAESEDMVQEVFIKFWERQKQHKITSERAYLYSMVRNKCINRLKKKNIINPCSLMEIKQIMASDTEDLPVDSNGRKVVYELVIKTVDTFPERMREIFKLKFFDNYKHTEIAEELGISVNTVKSQLKRAKSKIGQLISLLIITLINL